MAFVESEVVELKAEVVGDICKEVIAFCQHKRRYAVYWRQQRWKCGGSQKRRSSHFAAEQYDSRFHQA